jgi:hypothetical protein
MLRYNPGMNLKQRLFVTAAVLAALAFAPIGRAQGVAAGTSAGIVPGAAASDAEIERAVALICPPRDTIRGKDGQISGCRTCPKGTDFSGTGDRSQWELRSGTMWGHFTSASAENLLVSGFNCDSHANNFGGSYLFTQKTGKLRILKYEPALFAADCHAFPFSDGRDFLVCKRGWYGQGEGTGTVVVTSFDAAGESNDTNLFTVTDTTGTCAEGSSNSVQSSEIKDIKFSKKETGELTGMTVTATLGKIRCNQTAALQKGNATPASLKTYDIEFTFDGRQFRVAPQSKAIQALFEKD